MSKIELARLCIEFLSSAPGDETRASLSRRIVGELIARRAPFRIGFALFSTPGGRLVVEKVSIEADPLPDTPESIRPSDRGRPARGRRRLHSARPDHVGFFMAVDSHRRRGA